MIYETGSLFDTDCVAIAQGCNARGVMGAGIAKAFKDKWPDMYEEYRDLCNETGLDGGEMHVWEDEDITIFNLITQDYPGRNAKISYVRYSAYAAAVHAMESGIDYIAIPRIGCGIGGLEWPDVEENLLFIEAITGVEFEVWTPPLTLVK